jgi:ABC-2 type transport system permease protein
MTAMTTALQDSATMFRRTLLHLWRYPSMTLLLLGMPVVLLLVFVYVFGGTLGAGLPTGTVADGLTGRAAYLAYLTPAMVILGAASAAQGTAISVATDMTGGIVARFKTMPISPGSVLAGRVLGAVVQSLLVMGVVLAGAVARGYRPTTDPVAWLEVLVLLGLTAFALTWLSVALGLVSDSVETASNLPMFLVFLPFLGSGFVPVESMPAGLSWFAEHQPFTPIMDAVRSLLDTGTAEASTLLLAVGWTLVIAGGGYAWARVLYRRER